VDSSTTVEVKLSGSELLCVAADPVRWRLLSALAAGTRCVCQLQPVTGVTAPALSHHLKVLREAGLVSAARRGRWIDYTLAPDAAARLRAALPLDSDQTATAAADRWADAGNGSQQGRGRPRPGPVMTGRQDRRRFSS
jgi:ArsR family transcriptional regulator